MTRLLKRFIFLLWGAVTLWSSQSLAACHPSSDWLIQPDNETRVVFTEDRLWSLVPMGSSDPTLVFPKTVSDTELAALNTVHAPWPKRVFATFFEPTGKNTWRSCREELWWIASNRDQSDRPGYELIRKALKPHKDLRSLAETHELSLIKLIHFDESGRLSKINEGSTSSAASPRRDTYCRRYDSANRITMVVQPEAGQCPTGQPLAEDRFEIYKYRPNTTDTSDKSDSYSYRQWPNKEATWKGEGRVILDNDPKAIVGFKAQFAQGIVQMIGHPEARLGSKDDNPSNTVADYVKNRGPERSWAGSTYVFTQPGVPFSVLDNRDELYKYERRRVTNIVADSTRLYELFKPNEHLSRDRYYFGGGTMLRHEQYDEQGRIKRIITYRNYRQPMPGPNPTFNDDLLPPDPTSLRLLGRDIYHRVYDIDEQGKAKLVAMSWSDKHRLSPFSKPKHLDFTYVIYGTPDGIEAWRNREEFDKAFNTDKLAKALFPDVERREAEARRK